MTMTREKQERLSEDIHLLGDILGHVIRRQAGIEIFELEAVSYTHLTLPTNREV